MRKHTLKVALVLVGAFLSTQVMGQAKSATPKKPNIIFILTDDLGYGDLGVLFQKQRQKKNDRSEPWAYTPNLDKMAEQGAILNSHYAAAPVCAPSRASFLLGQSQGHANVRDNQFDKALADNHNVATVLKEAGYTTAAIGKYGLQGQREKWTAHPLDRGFDYYYGYMRHGDGHEHYPVEGVYRGPKEVYENRKEVSAGLAKSYTADLWTAKAKNWIVEHEKAKGKDSPFFMYLAYDTPHAVLELPTQAYPTGGGLKGGLQWLGKPGQMINTASGQVDGYMHPDYANATYDHDNNAATAEVAWPEVYKRYAASVRRIDDAVGDLLQLLKDLDIDENTMVVFTSDNGPSMESYLKGQDNDPIFFNSFGPFDGTKRDVWEGGVRMPALAWWPGKIPANHVLKTPNASHDWLPTFSAAAGLPAPAKADGVSLLPGLTKTGEQPKSQVYVEYVHKSKTPDFAEFSANHRGRQRNQMQIIRLDDLVGVRYNIQGHSDDFEIYNVEKDPQQTKNLAREAGMQKLQQQMKDKVLQLRRPDESAPRPYDDELVPAANISAKKVGLNWKKFEGDFPWVPQITSLKPTATGNAKSLEPTAGRNKNSDLLYYEGYVKVPADGTYTFYLTTDKGAVIRLHEALLFDADYGYKSGTELQEKINLKAGLHPIRVYYAKGENTKPQLALQWEGPGFAKQTIPAKAFFRE